MINSDNKIHNDVNDFDYGKLFLIILIFFIILFFMIYLAVDTIMSNNINERLLAFVLFTTISTLFTLTIKIIIDNVNFKV